MRHDKPTLGVAEVLVDRAGVDDRDLALELVGHVEEVGVQPDLDVGVVSHLGEPGGVAVDRQPLVGVAEPAVLERVADREPGDDVRAQLGRVGLPLLGRVALDERLVERAADQADRLLLEVGGVLGGDLAGLLLDQRTRLVRGVGLPEELVDQAEVHRQREDLALVLAEDPVLVVGEGGEPVDVLPDPLVGGVEEVRAVLVHLDSRGGFLLGVGVAAQVVAPLDHEHLQPQLAGAALRDGEAEEAGADDDEVRCGQRVLLQGGRAMGQSTDVDGWCRIPRAARRARITLPASALPPRSGLSRTTNPAINHGL